MSEADLRVPPGPGLPNGLTVPAPELLERFSRSSGPGGQSVNTADSRVELRWDLDHSSALTCAQRTLLAERLGARLVDGAIAIAASEHRSQLQNRQAARARLVSLLRDAFVPATPRRASRPSRAARQRRLDAKKVRAQVKSGRGRIRPD